MIRFVAAVFALSMFVGCGVELETDTVATDTSSEHALAGTTSQQSQTQWMTDYEKVVRIAPSGCTMTGTGHMKCDWPFVNAPCPGGWRKSPTNPPACVY